jgi:serine/threonine-protein kinase PpkA
LEQNLSGLDEATVSTHSFDEDAFAGIHEAVTKIDWSPYAFKIAVLITDAGAIGNDDKYSKTGMDEHSMHDFLDQKGIQLVVVHLRTPAGKRHNIDKTAQQYSVLTKVSDGRLKNKYIGLEAVDPKSGSVAFGNLSNVFTNAVVSKIQKASSGGQPEQPVQAEALDPGARAAQIAASLGYAAELEFVGQQKNTQAPSMVEAWIADKDLVLLDTEDKRTDTVKITVLLTKRQLDSLGNSIKDIIDSAKMSAEDSNSSQFFDQIISLAANTLRDPEKLQSGGNITQLGDALPEFLDGLPYVSDVMSLNLQDWIAKSSDQRDAFVRNLESKYRLYQEYHNDSENWLSFDGASSADALFRVPLSSLP